MTNSDSTELPVRFSKMFSATPQELVGWFLKEFPPGRDSLEIELQEQFRDGQCCDAMKRIFLRIEPNDLSRSQIADSIGVHPSQISRFAREGKVTLPVLIQFLTATGQQPENLGPFPPPIISVLAGLAKAVPVMQLRLLQRQPPGSPNSQIRKGKLKLFETALLFSLFHNENHLERWITQLKPFRHNAFQALRSPWFTTLLDEIGDDAQQLISFDGTALMDLRHLRASAPEREPFCRKLVTL